MGVIQHQKGRCSHDEHQATDPIWSTSLALLGGTGAGVAAAQTDQTQWGGAAGLVAAVVQAQLDDTVDIRIVDSLNNLRALNNSPILSNNDIDLTLQDLDVEILNLEVGDVTVQDFLNENDIDVDAVLGVIVLDTGDIPVVV